MTQEINVIHLNNFPTLYTKLVLTPFSLRGNEQYLQINRDKQLHLIETVSLMSKTYRGVTIDNNFWFLVEDLVELNSNSQNRKHLIDKLLNNISNEYKGFVNAVDSRGNIREVLMVSKEGLIGKLLT